MKLFTIKATLMVAFLLLVGLFSWIGWKRSSATIDFKKMEEARLAETQKQTTDQFTNILKNIGASTDVVKPDILNSTDTLRLSMAIELLDTMKKYVYAGVLAEKLAEQQQSDWRYLQSARYFLLETYSHEQPENEFMFTKKAKVNLEKCVAINPLNYAAKIDLAICTKNVNDVQPPSNPIDLMKPAQLLLEVNRAQPNNTDALYYLGKLAVETQQFEKAIERFKKLVSLQPQNQENYLELSDIYLKMGNEKESKLWSEKAQRIK
jgi:tetratricopeptide (TPR) repeat protein